MATATATRNQVRSDEDIQRDVIAELKWEPRVTPSEIGVVVKDGVVVLTGWVDSYLKKWAAEEAAHRMRGVKAVANDIEVRLPSTAERTDADIAVAGGEGGGRTGRMGCAGHHLRREPHHRLVLLGGKPMDARAMWDPWQEMRRLQRDMEHLFADVSPAWRWPLTGEYPPINVTRADAGTSLEALCPGVDRAT